MGMMTTKIVLSLCTLVVSTTATGCTWGGPGCEGALKDGQEICLMCQRFARCFSGDNCSCGKTSYGDVMFRSKAVYDEYNQKFSEYDWDHDFYGMCPVYFRQKNSPTALLDALEAILKSPARRLAERMARVTARMN